MKLALCLLLFGTGIVSVSAKQGKKCSVDEDCCDDECCQKLSDNMSKRDFGGFFEPQSSCQPYKKEGDYCETYDTMNGYCGCGPGLFCKTEKVPITSSDNDIPPSPPSPPSSERSDEDDVPPSPPPCDEDDMPHPPPTLDDVPPSPPSDEKWIFWWNATSPPAPPPIPPEVTPHAPRRFKRDQPSVMFSYGYEGRCRKLYYK